MQQTLFLTFALAAAHASTARATTYQVAPTGNDANAGTAAAPWKTLQKAANSVKAGDTVLVADGTYAPFFVRDKIGSANQRIVFQSKTKWGAKITGSTQYLDGIDVLSSCFVTIDGFEVSGSGRAGICVRSFTGQGDGADTQGDVVQNCFSHGNGLPSGGAHDGIFTGFALNFSALDNICDGNGEHGIYVSNSADNPVVKGNRCSNNRNCGVQLNADLNTGNGDQDGLISGWLVANNVLYGNGVGGGAAINLDGDIFGVCRNNLIYNNLASGIALYGIDGAEASHDNLVVNNTIYDPNSTRAALLVTTGPNNVAFNNILISKTGIELDGAANFRHNYNVVSSYDGLSATGHEFSASASQLFVSTTDFRPNATSLARNAGIQIFAGQNAPLKDLVAQTRPLGTGWDIGCYENTRTMVGGSSEPSGAQG